MVERAVSLHHLPFAMLCAKVLLPEDSLTRIPDRLWPFLNQKALRMKAICNAFGIIFLTLTIVPEEPDDVQR